ncbi:uncharacterized protein B0P05DRAFT_539383 [Gilbertella persicaria]|uniref:Uncharacterized protein n=1 Tax=Rhizopus stolonifer TaxID=4846 RepID=A0A367K4N4_RHIST|nr:uncharacterized protein B0P05DRAFT_539383 [Gilbertella persicaria]KAI8080734.1 hypothetical protein B0P05DRAFT_539383 [Gilbertella persicaria]RCH97222.1 hypothetical protein CU098_004327 [Rhizopus stolonifer]
MNKLKNVFQRSQKLKTEERRPQQFIKRLSTTNSTPTTNLNEPPEISLSELSETEREAYESWWKDLSPFGLEVINNPTLLKFLNGCSLPDNKLEQILALFESATEGLNKLQFFAMLRLIAHAQNGRKISRALVYLGAPIPHFHTNPFDALIKTIPETNNTAHYQARKSWWGQEKEQQSENRRSYLGPFTTHTPIPTHDPTVDFFYPQDWNQTMAMRPALNSSVTTTAIAPTTPAVEKPYTHSRSRSAGTADDFNPYQRPEEELQSSKSSLSLHELNTGQTLLLTQKFVYQSPSIRNQEIPNNNPFTTSPFDDPHTSINQKPNQHAIPPPPVPSQSTKPAFPKYTRTNTFIKRSQSSATDRTQPYQQKHQRHKSFY